ncbi:30S ribosomal protein S16 [candidate division WWE3 bacterium CG08_land_8_20_14_0_20_41_15]|uniref:30S ribosomal protein S16 n=1 Tax=candidate division WWE3 bacterium CG08_land_8_20_14_0_20_41_15 TaxID=1975086 RepID=A0A2H0XBE5_UNCKA|nr:MAG: 30S ribosomal protein S16 [candidate division WWE3 bacterium CG08_land_8_20_14_0_20_41_15]
MVKIRLIRTGKRNNPTYRLAVLDHHAKAKGTDPVEIIGFFNPSLKKDFFKYDQERYNYWTKEGAQATKSIIDLINGKYKYEKYAPKKAGSKEEEPKQIIEETKPTEIAPTETTVSA